MKGRNEAQRRREHSSVRQERWAPGQALRGWGRLEAAQQGAEPTSQGSPLRGIAARPRHSFGGLLDSTVA